jgi:8-amino-7-oxononanoate synthase
VDEAHATGVLGEHGRGGLETVTASRGRLPPHVIAMGTLSKALGSQGGFICATQTIINVVLHAGRAYMFSTALAPASAAAALAALKLIDAEPQRRTHLLQLSRQVRAGLAKAGLNVSDSEGPIVPVLAGAEPRATDWSAKLLAQGLLVPAVRYPTVKRGQARLRISLSAGHTSADCEDLLSAIRSACS